MNWKRRQLYLISILTFFYMARLENAFAQERKIGDSAIIICLNPVYSSRYIEFSAAPEGEDLYLLQSDRPVRIDSLINVFSSRKYSRMGDILDSLNTVFKVYSILNANKIKDLEDLNNYPFGYLFFMNDEVRRSGPVMAFLISRYKYLKKVSYNVINDKCKDFPGRCTIVINDIQ
jgi:hypothetical protein